MQDDIYVFSDDSKSRITNVKAAEYGTLYVPEGVRTVDAYAFSEVRAKNIVLPSTLENIYKAAFKGCTRLEKIYIPASVKKISDEAFLNDNLLEIYCEGEPAAGWLNGKPKKKVFYDDMTDAFNFHRSGGSFDDCYIVERVEITYNNFNPDNRPVHTFVPLKTFLDIICGDEKDGL